MKQKGAASQTKIVAAADDLFYKRGFNQTSFADIARQAEMPKGNIYYYFKTKDEILAAVITYRLDGVKSMLQDWQQTIATPKARLKRFVTIVLNEEANILQYGCPTGSLTSELLKIQPSLHQQVHQMFDVFLDFIREQLIQIGMPSDARQRAAQHILVWTQGINVVASSYQDSELLRNEIQQLFDWIEAL